MVRKHLVIIGRDAAPPVSDILRHDSAASGMQGPPTSTLRGYGLAIFTPEFPKADSYLRNEDKPESYLFSFHSAHPSRDVVLMNAGRRIPAT